MDFGTTTKIKSLALTSDLPDTLYPTTDTDKPVDAHKAILADVVRLLGPMIGKLSKGYNLIVTKEAMQDFCRHGNEVYKNSHKEATGIHLGYYLHDPDDPDIKVGIATTFLPATGDASTVTCEFSYADSSEFSLYAEEHRLTVIDWPHTHPGFGVFYSSTDCQTLKTTFNAEQHAGIVVDNLQNRYLAYKIIDGKQEKIPIWGFSLEDCRKNGRLELFQYHENNAPARKSISMGNPRPSMKFGSEVPPKPKNPQETLPKETQVPDFSADLSEIEERLRTIEDKLDALMAIPEDEEEAVALPPQRSSFPTVEVIVFVALTYGFAFAMSYLKNLMI